MLDEPVNGLDPEGVLWIRTLLTGLAAEGRTVFVSSHLMSEMAQTATNLVVFGRGKLLADTTVEGFIQDAGGTSVKVRTSEATRLRDVLTGPDVQITGSPGSEELTITGLTARNIGQRAFEHGIAVYELTTQTVSLETAFMAMTGDSVEYHATSITNLSRSAA
jgi:ABC-2 type transport system ATP-binding protein